VPEQLIIGFNPMSATNKVAYSSSQIRGRLTWLVVSVVWCVVIWLWQRQSLSTSQTAILFGVGIAYSLIWLGIAVVSWMRAKRALAAISPGVAVTVDRQGMWVQGTGLAWAQIAGVAAVPGRFGGSPLLRVSPVAGPRQTISLANLDVMPGTIDAAIRAYSAGTQWIDTAKLGN